MSSDDYDGYVSMDDLTKKLIDAKEDNVKEGKESPEDFQKFLAELQKKLEPKKKKSGKNLTKAHVRAKKKKREQKKARKSNRKK